ncbi:MAG TPA: hypothetical protein VLU23_15225 [Pseudolabrys sp.]|nr:hypothetical protein [Pseudolabrys sp.]
MSTIFNQSIEFLDRIPHIGFIVVWFALALLLACALIYVWNSIAARHQTGGNPPGSKQN